MGKAKEIIPSERQELAEEFFTDGYNCCQSVVLAFEDLFPFDRNTLLSISSGFGGGFGRLREVCGAVSGMTIAAGLLAPAMDPSNMAQRRDNYALVQRFALAFKEQRGSIVCRELLGMRKDNADSAVESPQPSERTGAYYHSRPCQSNVGLAARIVAEYLVENN